MRVSPPLSVMLIVAAGLAWSAHLNTESKGYDIACEAVSAYLTTMETKPDVFSGPPLMMSIGEDELRARMQQYPATDLYRSVGTLQARSISEIPLNPLDICPELGVELKKHSIAFDQESVAVARDYRRAVAESPTRPIYILSMRLPLVSGDKRTVLVDLNFTSAMFRSGESIVLLRDANGNWSKAEAGRTWVS